VTVADARQVDGNAAVFEALDGIAQHGGPSFAESCRPCLNRGRPLLWPRSFGTRLAIRRCVSCRAWRGLVQQTLHLTGPP
jgi:hypothetical protein